MKPTEMIDLGARLDGIIYKRDLNRLTRYIVSTCGGAGRRPGSDEFIETAH